MTGNNAYAMRTLIGPWLVFPAIGLEAVNFVQRGMPWIGEGLWTVQWFPIALFLLGPLCTGAAAVDAARLTRPGSIHLVRTAPRPYYTFLYAAMWCAVPVMAIHLLAIIAGLGIGTVSQPSVGWGWLVMGAGVQLAAIMWYVAIGSLVGRFMSPILAGVVGTLVGFGAFFFIGDAGGGESFTLLDLGAATVSRLGLAYNGTYVVAQGAILLITSVAFLIVGIRVRSSLVIPTHSGKFGMAFGVIVILISPSFLPADRLVEDPQPPDMCWTFYEKREACMYAEHSRFRDEVSKHLRTMMVAADSNGYHSLIPMRIEEQSRTYRPAESTAVLDFAEAYESGSVTVPIIAKTLIFPAHCPQLSNPNSPPGRAFFERLDRLLVTWISIVGGDLSMRGVDSSAYEGVPRLSPEEVTQILDDFAACKLSDSR